MRGPIGLLLVFAGQLFMMSALAVGDTSETAALRHWMQQRAPLAVSGDGAWRFHVDRNQVLHRSSLRSGGAGQALRLPIGTRILASSHSGERVAFSAGSQCVGVVDFNAGTPALRWVAEGETYDTKGEAVRLDASMPPVAQCAGDGNSILAISGDGRLLATTAHVIDIDSGKVVARLPRSTNQIFERAVIRLAFIDNGTRLLVASRTLGEGYESLSMPSNLQLAVWDLASGALSRLDTVTGGEWNTVISNFAAHVPATGFVYRIDDTAYARSRKFGLAGGREAPLRLVRHALGQCGTVPQRLLALAPDQWENIAVDPRGRWLAGVRKRDPGMRLRHADDNVNEEVLVHDIVTGAVIARYDAPAGMRGLMFSPDGQHVWGLTAVPVPNEYAVRENFGGDLVAFRLAAPLAPDTATPVAVSSATCAIDDEVPHARQVVHAPRKLAPLWTRRVSNEHRMFLDKDKHLWLDAEARFERLNPRTGQTERMVASGRRENEAAVMAPLSGGLIFYNADTLSWRPLASSTGKVARVVDKRQGWHVGSIDVQGRGVVVLWFAHESTTVPTRRGARLDGLIATYDAATLRLVRLQRWEGDSLGMLGHDADSQYAPTNFPLCRDSVGPMRSGFDWRLSHFDSVRLVQCGAGRSRNRTVLWPFLSVTPPLQPVKRISHDTAPRDALAFDAGLAVARDGTVLRVFDTASRREIAAVDMMEKRTLHRVFVMAAEGMLVVEARDGEDGAVREIIGYSLRRQ